MLKQVMDFFKPENRLPAFTAVLLFVFMSPYFLWGYTRNYMIMIPLQVLFALIFLKERDFEIQKSEGLKGLFIVTVVWYIMVAISHGNINFNGVLSRITLLLFVYIPFAQKKFSQKVYRYFLYIYIVIIAISLLVWVGAISGILAPIGTINQDEHDRVYSVYPCLLMIQSLEAMRFMGPFNEPGVVGTMSALLLCINKFEMRDWKNLLILASGICSLSLFFFIIIIVYGLIYFITVKRSIWGTIFIIATLALGYSQTKDNPILYTAIWERLEWDSTEHHFKGDNRVNYEADRFYDNIKHTSEFYFGVDDVEAFWNQVGETSSYKVVVIYNGIIFLVIYLLFFILMAFIYRDPRSIIPWGMFVLVLCLNTYQRPDIYAPIMVFLYGFWARNNTIIEKETYL